MKKIMLLVISLCLSISITGCSANQAISELQGASGQEEPASSASETSVTGNASEEGRRMEQSVYTIPVPRNILKKHSSRDRSSQYSMKLAIIRHRKKRVLKNQRWCIYRMVMMRMIQRPGITFFI